MSITIKNIGSAWLSPIVGESNSATPKFTPPGGPYLGPSDIWTDLDGGTDGWYCFNIRTDSGESATYLGTSTLHWKDPQDNWAPLDPPVSFDSQNQRDGLLDVQKLSDGDYTIRYTKSSRTTPPIDILNDWTGGQTGKQCDPVLTPASYWVQDYGFDDKGRWICDNEIISQTTIKTGSSQYGYNFGSRAFPVNILDSNYETDDKAYGVGMNGVWQIDIKIGSDGTRNNLFCETFYLAERNDMYWDVKNYLDNSVKGGSGKYSQYGREIDIMETKWNGGSSTEVGPQYNLPSGNPSDPASQMGWSISWWNDHGQDKSGVSPVTWDKFYGAPATDFATFGCAILPEGLYFYGYKGETQIYCVGPIVQDNSSYTQKSPLVPYIGTWTDSATSDGGFVTSYKNFVYKTQAEVSGKNPKDNPELFGPAL
jgi:hypothetical protein